MRKVLLRLWNRGLGRAFWAGWGALTIAGLALVAVPMLGQPGYELSEALSLLLGLAGPLVVVPLGRAERAQAQPSALGAVAAATLTLWSTAALIFVAATAWTYASGPCNPFALAAFFPVLVLPTGLLAAAVGVALGAWTRRWWTALGLWLLVVLASALHTAWPLLLGPQVFAYNHLAGYLPGPLYDEVLHLPRALLLFRVGTVLLAVVAGGVAARGLCAPRWPRVALVAGLLFVALDALGPKAGFRQTDAALEQALGGRTETEHATIFHAQALTPEQRTRVADDVEFRISQVSAFFGGAPEGKVRVWWYPSAAEKQRLVGAEHTQFSKPWRREVHVNASAGPHGVLKHELVHALAAPWGSAPFGIAARLFGLSPHVGVIEGLAVAADDPADELTLHQWAAAMKQQGLLPDVRTLLSPQGFYAAPPSRAYASAGSFLRWLADTAGREKLRLLYREGDFAQVYGRPLADLVTDWERFLDAQPLDAQAVNQAFARFKGGSLFERPCAREVALELEAAANAEAPHGEHEHRVDAAPLTAIAHFERCRVLQPDEPAHALASLRWQAPVAPEETRQALAQLAAAHQEHPTVWADATLALASLEEERGAVDEARARLEVLLARDVSPSMNRTARVRLLGLATPGPVQQGVRAYFGRGSEAERLERLRAAFAQAPDSAPLAYLLGRKLWLAGQFQEAQGVLAVTATPPPEGWSTALAREAGRLRLESAALAGDCALALTLGAGLPPGSAAAAQGRDLLERCEFVARRQALR